MLKACTASTPQEKKVQLASILHQIKCQMTNHETSNHFDKDGKAFNTTSSYKGPYNFSDGNVVDLDFKCTNPSVEGLLNCKEPYKSDASLQSFQLTDQDKKNVVLLHHSKIVYGVCFFVLLYINFIYFHVKILNSFYSFINN